MLNVVPALTGKQFKPILPFILIKASQDVHSYQTDAIH